MVTEIPVTLLLPILSLLGTPVLTFAAAWGAVGIRLRHHDERLKSLEAHARDIDAHLTRHERSDLRERLDRLEDKIDRLLESGK